MVTKRSFQCFGLGKSLNVAKYNYIVKMGVKNTCIPIYLYCQKPFDSY